MTTSTARRALPLLLAGTLAALSSPLRGQAPAPEAPAPEAPLTGVPADEALDPLLEAALRWSFSDSAGAARAEGQLHIARGSRRRRDPSVEAARFTSRADSLAWVRTRRAAGRDDRFRVVVSLIERRVDVLLGDDTLLSAPAAVAANDRLAFAGRTWTFSTPRGLHRVVRKEADPLWIPPDWHYAEVARDNGLRLGRVPGRGSLRLADGSRLTVRDRFVGVIPKGSRRFMPLPVDEEVVFDETLFIPPVGSLNRRIDGELGRYRLDLGDGYLLHGTPEKDSIGNAVTHGCVRLNDEDIEWLYDHVPVGTPVYIY